MSLAHKVALVTGSSKGIGRAIALRLAADGADVIVNYARSAAEADEVVAQITALGRRAVALQADVAQPASLANLFAQALAAFGQLDIVVANAGYELIEIPFTDYTEAQFDQVFDINVKGTFFTMQQAARHIRDGGRIIVIASNTSLLALPTFAVYGASKLAPHYFVQVLAKEIGPRGVTVNSVGPGVTTGAGVFTHTATDDAYLRQIAEATPLRRLGSPDDVANVVAFVASEAASFMTGHYFSVDGGNAMG